MNDAILSWQEFLDQDIASSRHRGNEESRDAFSRVAWSIKDSHRKIMRLFDRNGPMSAKEIAAALGEPLNCISGRVSELRAGQYLEPTDMRRAGSRVLRRTAKGWA